MKKRYTNAYASIHRKLMGLLCKYDFRITFICGIRAAHQTVELYHILGEDRYFLFYPSRNLFLFCDREILEAIDLSNTVSRKQQLIQELMDKNDRLRASAEAMKIYMPGEIDELLEEHYKKISDINFLQHIGSIDVQANILKAMLNTDAL